MISMFTECHANPDLSGPRGRRICGGPVDSDQGEEQGGDSERRENRRVKGRLQKGP